MRLSQEQPSDQDEISQNSTACVDGHRAAVQEKDTANVEHLTHGAKRDIAQWCSRSYRDCHAVTEYHTVEWKTSADRVVAEFQRQKAVLRVSATRCCELPDRGVREHPPRTHDHAVAQYYVVVLEVPGRPRSGKLPQSGTGGRERATDRKAAFSNVTLLGFKRILVRSDNQRTLLSLIERVMSNLTGAELVQCS